ncbi:MAG: CHAT domain-containing protein, partial [Chloroflexota bacterium]|nr:CHAT domain-containing protein [Chloroflexota bacterium]
EDLNLFASTRKVLPGAPLVFINACESAELSPLFYDGFAPYFMAKGARGVIGAECETPALFAAEWARRFFDQFLAGESLGQVFLDLRREFYYEHHNLLGLLYALYADGDTCIVPGVKPCEGLKPSQG